MKTNPNLSLNITGGIFPIMSLFLNGSIFFGLILAEKIGHRTSMIILQLLLAIVVFISSYMPNFWLFAIFYGIFFGIIAGLSYMLPVHIGFMHYPNRRLSFLLKRVGCRHYFCRICLRSFNF